MNRSYYTIEKFRDHGDLRDHGDRGQWVVSVNSVGILTFMHKRTAIKTAVRARDLLLQDNSHATCLDPAEK
jgi:hypothetical protein